MPFLQKNVVADDDGSASFDDEAENLDVTERLLRKVSKRPGLSDSGWFTFFDYLSLSITTTIYLFFAQITRWCA